MGMTQLEERRMDGTGQDYTEQLAIIYGTKPMLRTRVPHRTPPATVLSSAATPWGWSSRVHCQHRSHCHTWITRQPANCRHVLHLVPFTHRVLDNLQTRTASSTTTCRHVLHLVPFTHRVLDNLQTRAASGTGHTSCARQPADTHMLHLAPVTHRVLDNPDTHVLHLVLVTHRVLDNPQTHAASSTGHTSCARQPADTHVLHLDHTPTTCRHMLHLAPVTHRVLDNPQTRTASSTGHTSCAKQPADTSASSTGHTSCARQPADTLI
ncbi:hypothetical protein J6590_040610 [Homalodisca vitripennis]|nr:hypothetical protein J6590_040610 [Homalodisca vitripennis]